LNLPFFLYFFSALSTIQSHEGDPLPAGGPLPQLQLVCEPRAVPTAAAASGDDGAAAERGASCSASFQSGAGHGAGKG